MNALFSFEEGWYVSITFKTIRRTQFGLSQFASHAEAFDYVCEQAARGSSPHQRAIAQTVALKINGEQHE